MKKLSCDWFMMLLSESSSTRALARPPPIIPVISFGLFLMLVESMSKSPRFFYGFPIFCSKPASSTPFERPYLNSIEASAPPNFTWLLTSIWVSVMYSMLSSVMLFIVTSLLLLVYIVLYSCSV